MTCEPDAGVADAITADLVRMLHQGAAADEFAGLLAQVERMPEDEPRKAGLVEYVRMAMAVRNRLDLGQQRESGLLAVIDSARDLSSRLDLQELLRAILQRACTIMGSQVAWLSVYDPARAAFHVLAADGALAQSTGAMVAAQGRGIVSVVLDTRLPFTTSDYLHDTRFAHDPALDATFRDEGIAAVAGVPMLWNDEVIGLLFVADRYHRTHRAQSISILCTLATHAALALKNARAFEEAGLALASAEAARGELEVHVRRMQAAAEAHEQMTSLLARGASLAALCETIARLLQGHVLVLDEAAQVIARGSPGPAGSPDEAGSPDRAASDADRYTPHGEHSSALAAALHRSRQLGRSVPAYEAGGESCRLTAVIGGNDVLGSVLLFRRHPLDDVATRTFERSATIVGIVLLSRERLEATRTRDIATLLRALVAPRQDDLALLCERAARLGLDLARPAALLLLEAGPAEAAAHLARRLRAANLLPGAVFDEIDGVLAVLCGAAGAEQMRRTVCETARADAGAAWRGMLSRPLATPAAIPPAYQALRRALPVLRRMGVHGQVPGQDEMALYATLFETQDPASLASFLETTVGALTGHDRRRGTELAATLLCYFDCGQNAKAVAQRLGLHVNTVRQRLATIESLLGPWQAASRALEIHVALRLWHLGGAGSVLP